MQNVAFFFYDVVNFKACTVIISAFAIQECQNPLAPFFTYYKHQLRARPQQPVSKRTYSSQGISSISVEANPRVYNKITNIRQHNKYLLEYVGYMFRPVNRSSSGHQ